jgi:hypothetical protein
MSSACQIKKMTKEEIFEILKLFNEKAEKLRSTTFIKKGIESPGGIRISYKKGHPITAERAGPTQEEIDAFVLTFRFFIQKNERCSFVSMAKVYENPALEQVGKERFAYIRNVLNRFLDQDSIIGPESEIGKGRLFKNREIMDIFLYGDLSHANATKKRIFDEWVSAPPGRAIFTNEFVIIAGKIMELIWEIVELNYVVMNRSNVGKW